MHITVVTLFPEMFSGPFSASIIKNARTQNLVDIGFVSLRDFATDRYKSVDDHPFGGGTGMIVRVDVVDRAIASIRAKIKKPASPAGRPASPAGRQKPYVVLLDPGGAPYTQKKAQRFSKVQNLILLCGHYEGFDERVRTLVDEEISIGDYILTGGEIPAMVIVDSVVRLIPGVLRDQAATREESFSPGTFGLLEYPQYTKPRNYRGMNVPDVLLSGNHAAIAAWRQAQSSARTGQRRPDLLKRKKQ